MLFTSRGVSRRRVSFTITGTWFRTTANTHREKRFKNPILQKEIARMPTNINRSRVQRSKASTSLNATIPIAVVLLGFAILHVIGAAVLQPRSAALPTEDTKPMLRGD
jgi:hypothetical protein